jgi:hypothetical protein
MIALSLMEQDRSATFKKETFSRKSLENSQNVKMQQKLIRHLQ